jgi:hypothetical protein
VAAAAALPGAPERFEQRVNAAFAQVDGDPLHLTAAIDTAADLVLDTVDACAMMAPTTPLQYGGAGGEAG